MSRQLEIDKQGDLKSDDIYIVCPIKTPIHKDDGVAFCNKNCAWFKIDKGYVFCGEKRIGHLRKMRTSFLRGRPLTYNSKSDMIEVKKKKEE